MEAEAAEAGQAPEDKPMADLPPPAPSIPIATEEELHAFALLAPAERILTPQLRGVLAETALTGTPQGSWSFVCKPAVVYPRQLRLEALGLNESSLSPY